MNDPSYIPKLTLEFEEHIPGFFGKSKVKAGKKQNVDKMLWKRCLKNKEDIGDVGGKKKKRKNKVGLDNMIRQGVM